MTADKLIEGLENGTRYKITKVKDLQVDHSGVYAIFDRGNLVYVGVSDNSILSRVGRQHASGNSCTSSFCNYLRAEKGITVSTEESRMFPELATVKIEELKVRHYLDEHVTVSYIGCDVGELLEDVNRKPEDYLLYDYFPSQEVRLWNHATRQSGMTINLERYTTRLNGRK